MGLVIMSRASIRKAHRWLGLIFSLSILTSAGSGILHNVMTYTQAPPPPARPSGGGLAVERIAVPVAEVIAKLSLENVQAVNVRDINAEPWYQVFTGSGNRPVYVSAVDGRIDPLQDELYAAQIASAFLGGAKVRKAGYLTAFDKEYINIFRSQPPAGQFNDRILPRRCFDNICKKILPVRIRPDMADGQLHELDVRMRAKEARKHGVSAAVGNVER